MSFLIDTNIISEARKGESCDPGVAAWRNDIAVGDIWLSSLVLGEIRKGIELVRRNDPRKAEALERWLTDVKSNFRNRVLAVDTAVADEWGKMHSVRPLPIIDGLLAATAKVHELTFVTRSVADLTGLGVELLNPFEG